MELSDKEIEERRARNEKNLPDRAAGRNRET